MTTRTTALTTAAVAVLLILAGCSAVGGGDDGTATPVPNANTTTQTTTQSTSTTAQPTTTETTTTTQTTEDSGPKYDWVQRPWVNEDREEGVVIATSPEEHDRGYPPNFGPEGVTDPNGVTGTYKSAMVGASFRYNFSVINGNSDNQVTGYLVSDDRSQTVRRETVIQERRQDGQLSQSRSSVYVINETVYDYRYEETISGEVTTRPDPEVSPASEYWENWRGNYTFEDVGAVAMTPDNLLFYHIAKNAKLEYNKTVRYGTTVGETTNFDVIYYDVTAYENPRTTETQNASGVLAVTPEGTLTRMEVNVDGRVELIGVVDGTIKYDLVNFTTFTTDVKAPEWYLNNYGESPESEDDTGISAD